ncbi:MAG: toprim domain-containing protein [Saprospiraceae bacterium]|nr:toprim domain-containing protein [Saprospiraceae bacterium]
MNAAQAKKISLIELIGRLGYEPIRSERGGSEFRYLSPFRREKEGSFNVNIRKNSWFDFGESTGGNTLDFAVHYLRSRGQRSTVTDALSWLRTQSNQMSFLPAKSIPPHPNQTSFSFRQQQLYDQGEITNLQFLKAIPIRNKLIYEYLSGRGISSKDLIDAHVVEVHYRNLENQRDYWAMGFPNRSKNGYELRSCSDGPSRFKTSFNRDISVLQGFSAKRVGETAESSPSSSVNVFEGFMDYLTMCELLNTTQLTNDTIILHSLSSFKRAVKYIAEHQYEQIHLFLDNDGSGRKCSGRFIHGDERKDAPNSFGGFGDKVFDHGSEYGSYNDLNDALQAGHRSWPIAVSAPELER